MPFYFTSIQAAQRKPDICQGILPLSGFESVKVADLGSLDKGIKNLYHMNSELEFELDLASHSSAKVMWTLKNRTLHGSRRPQVPL